MSRATRERNANRAALRTPLVLVKSLIYDDVCSFDLAVERSGGIPLYGPVGYSPAIGRRLWFTRYCDDTGRIRGLISFATADSPRNEAEKKGDVCIHVDPTFARRGIATKLLDIMVDGGLPINFEKQRYYPDGERFIVTYLARRGIAAELRYETPDELVHHITDHLPDPDPRTDFMRSELRRLAENGPFSIKDVHQISELCLERFGDPPGTSKGMASAMLRELAEQWTP